MGAVISTRNVALTLSNGLVGSVPKFKKKHASANSRNSGIIIIIRKRRTKGKVVDSKEAVDT